MSWATPWAWALVAGVVLPLIAHLWSRRQPTPRPFSTLRFLRAASPVSRRLRRVQEWPLLALRSAIVVAIVAAAAGPTLGTAARQQAWRERLHRVIVVDAAVAPAAAGTLQTWRRTATTSDTLPPGTPTELLPDAIARASSAARDGRAEIAIAWNGRATALPPRALADVPAQVGIRLAPIETALPTSSGGRITIESAASDAAVAAALRETAATARVRSGLTLRVWLPGADVPALRTVAATRDAVAVLDALATDPRVRQAAERSRPDARASSAGAGARTLATDAQGQVLLRGWAEDARVEVVVAATPGSPVALWTVTALREALERQELDATSLAWTPDAVTRATRQAQVPPSARLPAGLDTRWGWGLALLLLVVEQAWRGRRGRGDADEEARDAA